VGGDGHYRKPTSCTGRFSIPQKLHIQRHHTEFRQTSILLLSWLVNQRTIEHFNSIDARWNRISWRLALSRKLLCSESVNGKRLPSKSETNRSSSSLCPAGASSKLGTTPTTHRSLGVWTESPLLDQQPPCSAISVGVSIANPGPDLLGCGAASIEVREEVEGSSLTETGFV